MFNDFSLPMPGPELAPSLLVLAELQPSVLQYCRFGLFVPQCRQVRGGGLHGSHSVLASLMLTVLMKHAWTIRIVLPCQKLPLQTEQYQSRQLSCLVRLGYYSYLARLSY